MRASTLIGTALAAAAVVGLIFNMMGNRGAQPPGQPGEPSAIIDFKTDANGDHLPDALVTEIQRLAAKFDHDLTEGNDSEALSLIRALSSRMPHAQGTRDVQKQAAALLAKQAAADDPLEKEKLAKEIEQLLGEAEKADPTYQAAMATVEKLAGDKFVTQAGQVQEAPDFGQLQRGDILFTRGDNTYLNWVYAQRYSHAGIYDGNGMVYESNPDGLRLKPLTDWQEPGHLVALARPTKMSGEQVQAALDWAEAAFKTDGSTHYNHDIPDKWAENKLYCSQLVWQINKHAGVDLDSNDFWYMVWISARLGPLGVDLAVPAVLPDEVALSDNITIYSSGVTR